MHVISTEAADPDQGECSNIGDTNSQGQDSRANKIIVDRCHSVITFHGSQNSLDVNGALPVDSAKVAQATARAPLGGLVAKIRFCLKKKFGKNINLAVGLQGKLLSQCTLYTWFDSRVFQ